MMKALPLLLLFPALLAAEDDKLAELTTLDGKFYQDVTIRKVEPDGLSILHKAGTAKISFEQLSESLREKYGYTAEAAADHRKKQADAQRALNAAEKAARKKKAKSAAAEASTATEKEFSEKVQKSSKMMKVRAFQNAQIGLIGDIHQGTLTKVPVKSKMGSIIGHKPAWEYRGQAIDGVIAETSGARVGVTVDDTGRPYGRPSVNTTVIAWEGEAWRIGKIEYVNLRGLTITVPYFTASRTVASDFYKKNGFSPKSDEIISKSH